MCLRLEINSRDVIKLKKVECLYSTNEIRLSRLCKVGSKVLSVKTKTGVQTFKIV